MSVRGRIDTHHHIVPPPYAAWLREHGLDAAGLPIPRWDRDAALAAMDEHDITASVMSVSTPGVHLGDDAEAREWARRVNEFAAEVVKDRPDRFGFFATLTLPDVDGALAEVAHAFDVLGADGVVLLANARGTYLGDAVFDPLFDELNRRRAVVFVHPSFLPGPPVPGIPPYMADFLLDTTRAAINLVRSGTLDRCPDIEVILSHAGGFVPYAAYRMGPMLAPGAPDAGVDSLRRFWFDTALSASPSALPSLLAFADPARIVFGSDWPYAPAPVVSYFVGGLNAFEMADAQRARIDYGNAATLFPRLSA